MKKTLLSLIIAVAMVITLVPMQSSAAGKTYEGPWPTLPNAVAKKAIQCSWPYGTPKSKYKYKGGAPMPAYKEALAIAYPERNKWGQKKSRVGASCDVFVGTVCRASGYDSGFPRALSKDLTYLPKTTDKWEKTKITKVKDMKPGDVIMYLNKGGGGHICIYVEVGGVGYIANAHYVTDGGTYGVMDAKAKDYNKSNYKSFAVYRQTKTYRTAFSRGDLSPQVKKLQAFLNWAGFNCGEPDGDFGPMTEEAVKAFQDAAGLEVDGEFGSQSLAAAKTYVPGTNSSGTQPAVSHYTGKYPTKVVSKNKGSKWQVKRWQRYLKWYGFEISVDGDFGKQTIGYTKKFQKKYNLKADGVVGKKTVAKAKGVTK